MNRFTQHRRPMSKLYHCQYIMPMYPITEVTWCGVPSVLPDQSASPHGPVIMSWRHTVIYVGWAIYWRYWPICVIVAFSSSCPQCIWATPPIVKSCEICVMPRRSVNTWLAKMPRRWWSQPRWVRCRLLCHGPRAQPTLAVMSAVVQCVCHSCHIPR